VPGEDDLRFPWWVCVTRFGVAPVQPLVTCEACGSASVGPPGVPAPAAKECREDPPPARTSPAIPGERARSLRLGPPCVPNAQQQRFARSALGRFAGAHPMHWSLSTPRRASADGRYPLSVYWDRRRNRLASASSPANSFESAITDVGRGVARSDRDGRQPAPDEWRARIDPAGALALPSQCQAAWRPARHHAIAGCLGMVTSPGSGAQAPNRRSVSSGLRSSHPLVTATL
jgi:hypothetical protein